MTDERDDVPAPEVAGGPGESADGGRAFVSRQEKFLAGARQVAESVDPDQPFVAQREKFLAVARKVLVEGPIPASLHDAYAQIERAVREG